MIPAYQTVHYSVAISAGSSHALPSSLSIPENPNPVAEVSPLQTPEVTPGQRDHRSRLQNRLYPAVQTIRDVMDHKWRASDLGPARDEAESGLGNGPSEVLGLKIDAGGVTRNAQSRLARATRRIGLWAESDYPRSDCIRCPAERCRPRCRPKTVLPSTQRRAAHAARTA